MTARKTSVPLLVLHFFLDDELHDDVSLEAVAAAAVGHGVVAVERDAPATAPALPAVHDGAVAAVRRLTDLRKDVLGLQTEETMS